jgi:hypothetical protein
MNARIWPLLPFTVTLGLLACSRGGPTEPATTDSGPPFLEAPPAIESADAGAQPVEASLVDASSFDGSVDSSADAAPEASAPDAPSADAADASNDSAPPAIAIAGTVTDSRGMGVVGRTVNVLDGAQATHVASTDAMGGFVMTGVVTPYTLTVSGPEGATLEQVCYVGVTTPTPHLYGFVPVEPAPAPAWAPFTTQVVVPTCGTASCIVSISAASPAGVGFSTTMTVPAGTTFPLSSSFEATTAGGLQVTFSVLVSDSVYSQYWFTQPTFVLTAGGAAQALGTLAPTPIPSAATLTVTASPVGPLSAWPAAQQSVYLAYGGGAGGVELGRVQSDTLSVAVPDILGATLSVQSLMESAPDGGPRQTSVGVMSSLPLTTTQASFTLSPPGTWTQPSLPGQAVSSTSTLSWQNSVPSGFSLVVLDDDIQGSFVFVFTPGTSLSLELLAKTGVVLAPDSYTLQVGQITPSPSLDAVLEAGDIVPLVSQTSPGLSWEGGESIDVTLTP